MLYPRNSLHHGHNCGENRAMKYSGTHHHTRIINANDANAIVSTCDVLSQGGVVAIPTETVYGLAGDATNGDACALIYETKGRPSFNPLIVHVPDRDMAEHIGVFSDTAKQLANSFWPGALTLVVPLRTDNKRIPIASLVTAGLDTVAIRVPARKIARDVLQHFGKPIAAPSANASGRISPTRAEHVLTTLKGRLPLILDDGACTVGIESTIVDTTESPLTILRTGGVADGDIEQAVGYPLRHASSDNTAPKSPGMLSSHYAPQLPVRLNVTNPTEDELVLGFGKQNGHINLSPSGNLQECASGLFDALHTLDDWNTTHGTAYTGIAVAPIPTHGLGAGINDRLTRAST